MVEEIDGDLRTEALVPLNGVLVGVEDGLEERFGWSLGANNSKDRFDIIFEFTTKDDTGLDDVFNILLLQESEEQGDQGQSWLEASLEVGVSEEFVSWAARETG